jgi:hypothetical protein
VNNPVRGLRWWQQHKERPMKYICLGYYDPARHAAMTDQEREAMFDECFEYDDHLRTNGHFAGGEALQPGETALTLYWKNNKVKSSAGLPPEARFIYASRKKLSSANAFSRIRCE